MRPGRDEVAGHSLALLAGGVWGIAFFSWGLPLPILVRAGATVLLLTALAAASRQGRRGAGVFAIGMGLSSAYLVAASGLFGSVWTLVPLSALLTGACLYLWSVRREGDPA